MAQAVAVKEATFKWEGTDRKGNRVKGETQGPSEAFIKQQLRKQGINPVAVRKQSALFGKRKKKITTGDIAIFLRQSATMMSAGVPLVQALEIVGRGHDNPSMGEMIMAVKTHIEGGNSFAASLAKFPLYFDDLVVNLVDAGEKSGTLEALLDKVATYKEKTEAIKKKVKKALTYPSAVMVVAFIVTGILLYFVVPQFQELFQGFGADLPAFTMLVIHLSEFVQNKWWVVLLVAGGSVEVQVRVRHDDAVVARRVGVVCVGCACSARRRRHGDHGDPRQGVDRPDAPGGGHGTFVVREHRQAVLAPLQGVLPRRTDLRNSSAFRYARETGPSIMLTRIRMIAITHSNSIKVNPAFRRRHGNRTPPAAARAGSRACTCRPH